MVRSPPRAVVVGFALLCWLQTACDGDAPPQAQDRQPPGAGLSVRPGLAGRVTPAQHHNLVQDVLGVQLSDADRAAAGGGIPEALPSTGLFRNGADGQASADDYPLAFARLAATVAERVDMTSLGIASCSDGDAACARSFVSELGLRLFRRPLSQREVDAFGALYARVEGEGLGFEGASRSVVEAMLQSPACVFRLERELGGTAGEKRYLDGFELGSRLSFFLWDSAPDAELLRLAQSGELSGTPAALPVLEAQARRMLADPRARRMIRELARDFAGTDQAAFIGVTPELRAALLDSLAASLETHLWQEQGTISGLFTSRSMSLDKSVAELMGLTPLGEGTRVYDVSSLPERVGFLTHPAFIAGMGDASVGKIVHRGVTLMVKLMCRQPAQLPEGLAATTADFNVTFAGLTERGRSEERQRMALPVSEGGGGNASCWGCHSQFEPLAYGFDRFDAAGRYLGEVDAQGRSLPIDGWMTDDLSVEEAQRTRYASVAELMKLMEQSDTVQACMAEHFIAYATGRASSSFEKELSYPVRAAEQRAGGTLTDMVWAVASSELFRALASAGPATDGDP